MAADSNVAALERALVEYRAGSISQADLAAVSCPLLQRLAASVCRHVGIPEDSGDVAQDLWLFLSDKIAQEYDASRALLPYLKAYTRNLALAIVARPGFHRETSIEAFASDDGEKPSDIVRVAGVAGSEIDIAQSPEDCVVDEIDRQSALAKASKKLYAYLGKDIKDTNNMAQTKRLVHPGVMLVNQEITPPSKGELQEMKEQAAAQERRRSQPLTLASDQQELVNIRNLLGMTQPDFASALSIPLARLASYEYGRTRGVPGDVMDAARQLQAGGNEAFTRAQGRFDHRQTSEILDGWIKMMDLDPEDPQLAQTIADLFGVTATTVRRWQQNQVKPNLAALIRYERLAKRAAEALARMKKSVQEQH